jgi:hypothetical protein
VRAMSHKQRPRWSFTYADTPEEVESFQYSSGNLDDTSKIHELTRELSVKNQTIKDLMNAKMQLHKEVMEQTQLFQNKTRLLELQNSGGSGSGASSIEIRRMKEEIRSLTSQKESKHLLIEKLSKESNELSVKNRKLREDLERYRQGILEREALCQRMAKEVEDLRVKYASFVDQENHLASLEEEIDRLRDQTEELQELLESTSAQHQRKSDEATSERERLEQELRLAKERCESPDFLRMLPLAQALSKTQERSPELFSMIGLLLSGDGAGGASPSGAKKCLRIADLVSLLEVGLLSLRPLLESEEVGRPSNAYEDLHGPPLSSQNGLSSLRTKPLSTSSSPSSSSSSSKNQMRRAPPRPPPRPPHPSPAQSTTGPAPARHTDSSHSKKLLDHQPEMSVLRLFDFLSQSQVLEIANYLCRTPLLTTKTIELMRVDSSPSHHEEEESLSPSPAHQVTAAEELVMNFGEDERERGAPLATSALASASRLLLSSQKRVRILEDSQILRSDSEQSDIEEEEGRGGGEEEEDEGMGWDGRGESEEIPSEEEEGQYGELLDDWGQKRERPLFHVDPTRDDSEEEQEGEPLDEDQGPTSVYGERDWRDPPDYWSQEEEGESWRPRGESSSEEGEGERDGSYIDDGNGFEDSAGPYTVPQESDSDSSRRDPDSDPALGSTEEEVSEHLCFIIHRGGEEETDRELTERWIEFSDPSTGLPYYHNPDTG